MIFEYMYGDSAVLQEAKMLRTCGHTHVLVHAPPAGNHVIMVTI